ncbi:hypothetical protein OIU78_019993 [Salix suchowensis]|nr:hypothetical protein OIU78_019993 [Salix suchowensis]
MITVKATSETLPDAAAFSQTCADDHSSPAKAEWDSAEDGFNIGPPNCKRIYCEGTAYSFLPSLNPPQFLKTVLDNMQVEEGRQSFIKPYEHPPVISMGDEVDQEING